MHRDRHAVPVTAEQDGHRFPRELRPRRERGREALAVPELTQSRGGGRGVHLPPGLLHHAEAAVAEA